MVKKQYKTDNGGFTLVEVLVAMVILAIIVVPLLHTFVSSARTNQRARQRLRVTTAAQDIMEGIKACTVEELAYQFNYPDVSHVANPLIDEANEFHVINRGLITGTIKEILYNPGTLTYSDVVKGEDAILTGAPATASMYSEDNGVEYEFLGQTSGNYYFQMEDVSVQTDRLTQFDALIHLDAGDYRAGGGASYESNIESVAIREMNNLYDAFYVAGENDTHNVLLYMNAMCSPIAEVKEEHLKRTIEIKIEKQVISGNTVVIGTVFIKYEAPGMGPGGTNIEYEPLGVAGKQIFSNVTSGMDLRNVYLFYYPIYNAFPVTDVIILDNQDQIPLNFHVTKQEPTSVDSTLASKEINYGCRLEIEDAGAGNTVNIKTNLTRNLWDAYSAPSTALAYISYYVNGAYKSPTALGTQLQNLSGVEQTDRLFDVTIELYEDGAAAAGFPAAMRVTTLSGSKNN